MTTVTASPTPTPLATGSPVGGALDWMRDIAALTHRNLIHIRREPAQLSDVTVQPVLFTLLFIGLFGTAMVLPGGGGYTEFAIGGLIALNLTTAAVGTAVGLSTDLATGVMNRFRTLPMARSAILTGRTMSDLAAAAVCGVVVVITGYVIGWRPGNGLPMVFAALGVGLSFAYALSWAMACMGLLSKDPETAQATSFLAVFPLAFLSSAVVPTQGLPTPARVIADWNPVSAVAGAIRELVGNVNPSALSRSFPNQHPLVMCLAWSALIIAICAPLATRGLERRMND